MKGSRSPEYSKLAYIYDTIMEDVDYEVWADFIDEIIQTNHPDPVSILELACGTGSMALSLDELMCYDIVATDKSPHMIKIARCKKRDNRWSDVDFKVMDFLDIALDRRFDAVISTFDSVNYLHKPRDIVRLLKEIKKVLKPDSIFVFDFTTPKNSIRSIKYLNNEEGYAPGNYRFFRKSSYNPSSRIHYNVFDIEKLDNDMETVLEKYHEVHKQKIYTLPEMLDIIDETEFTLLAKYDGFDLVEADESSLRITMVLQCPTIQ
ncbi:class I SAM-dependent DNA methyltransferase [Halalkalibaculum sp. DA384]|uniref:class I SAM-dependent DNA methyltransferase n=1 Tax=Halalkalibaculum sp. DA384 TaxID=3373606 RepID=UPI003754E71D